MTEGMPTEVPSRHEALLAAAREAHFSMLRVGTNAVDRYFSLTPEERAGTQPEHDPEFLAAQSERAKAVNELHNHIVER